MFSKLKDSASVSNQMATPKKNPTTATIPTSTSSWEYLAREAEFKPARLALLCGVSERHLQRVFKARLGTSPRKWLRKLQCSIAKTLVSQGYSSKAAAAESFFSTEAHFCREFKRIFGVPPQTFAPGCGTYARLAATAKGTAAAQEQQLTAV
jgi:AraC-like DNA-binding protein